jgi:hypothetical protein
LQAALSKMLTSSTKVASAQRIIRTIHRNTLNINI